MNLNVVYDKQGNILAAGVAGDGADQFVVQDGEYIDEFEAPGDLTENGLGELVENHRVDVESKKLIQQQ